MQEMQTTKNAERRIQWRKTLVNFATAIWVIATIIMGPVMLMKFAYRVATVQGNQHPVTDAACWGVWLGIIFTMIFGACIERKMR
jgi:hypothetical protein